jgi:hypothetical protein
MVWITSVSREDSKGRIQLTQVVAVAKIFQTEGSHRIVQIDTHGSEERENRGKQSQTIQFGKESAKQLFDIFKDTYGFE